MSEINVQVLIQTKNERLKGRSFVMRSNMTDHLIAILISLERAINIDADIVGLIFRQLRQSCPDFVEMKFGNLFIKMFWQNINFVFILIAFCPEFDLCKRLIGKRSGHDERRVPGRVAKIQKPTLR